MIDIEKIDLENLPPYGSKERKKMINDLKKLCDEKSNEYCDALRIYDKVRTNLSGYQGKYFRVCQFDKTDKDGSGDVQYVFAKHAYVREGALTLQGMNFEWQDSEFEDMNYAEFSWFGNIHVPLEELNRIKEVTKEEYIEKFSIMYSMLKDKFNQYFESFIEKEAE